MLVPTLYPAQVGSPYTTLAAPYTTGEATMTVVDATKLPDAPNIVCLAGTVAGEFRYSGKDGNTLFGVVKLPGTPNATWPIGTYAFRGIAAYDLNAIHENMVRTATYVVAASDAPEHIKQQADYVCDGIDDQVEIQAAIDALPATGTRKVILLGSFIKGNAPGISLPSNVTIELNGSITLANGIDADGCIFTNADHAAGNENIQIVGGVGGLLDGNEANQTTGIQCGVIFRKVDGLTVDLKIRGFRTLDMQIAHSCSRVVRNNRLRRQGDELDLVTIDDMSDPTRWSRQPNMTVTRDENYHVIGDASIDVYHSVAGTNRYITFTPATPLDLRDKVLRLWLRIPEESYPYITGSTFRLRLETAKGSYVMRGFTHTWFADKADGFIYHDFPMGPWAEQSAAFVDSDLSEVTAIKLYHYNSQPFHVWYGGLQMYTAPQQGAVSFSFDDGDISQFTGALPILTKYGFPAVAAIIPSRCFGSGTSHLTWDHVKVLQSLGWDIAQHSYAHTDYSTLTIPEIRDDINKSTHAMLRNGIRASGEFVFPWGSVQISDEFYATLRKYFHLMRRTAGGVNAIPTDPHYGRYIATDNTFRSASLAAVKAKALYAAKSGGWLDLYLHTVKDGGDVTPAEFDEFCAYLYDFGVPVKTWSQIAKSPQNTEFYPTGYIAPGETRSVTGSLSAGAANEIAFAWQNPEPCDILIKRVVINITAAGGTAGATITVGSADDPAGTNLGAEFFVGLDANAVTLNDSMVAADGGAQTKWVPLADSSSATGAWIVGKILNEAAASLAGTYYIEYVGA